MDGNMQNPQDTQANEDLIGSEISNLGPAGKALADELGAGKGKKYAHFIMAALGSIPWVGGYLSILSAVAGLQGEFDQDKVNDLQKLYIEETQEKIRQLGIALQQVFTRLQTFGEEVQKRIESPEYLSLVRSAFRVWDQADTEEKRQMVKKLITNAGASTLCPDDLVRLFIKWIDQYHESHFMVIKEIYKQPGITRGEIWDHGHAERPREDSAEADLFRYLIRELSTGGVIRQEKEVDGYGRFIKSTTHQSRGSSSVMESAFEDTKPYVLTELGQQFISYVLNDVVTRVGS